VRESSAPLTSAASETVRDDYAISLEPAPIDAAEDPRRIEQAALELLAAAQGAPIDSVTPDDLATFRASMQLRERPAESAATSESDAPAAGDDAERHVQCSTDQPRSDEELEAERLRNLSARADAIQTRRAAVEAIWGDVQESFGDAVVREAVERSRQSSAD
jgi:hypothetical protein